VRVHGHSDAGFQSGNEETARTYYGCYSRQTGSAGRLIATSHRVYGSQVQVRNSSGGTREIIVLGPAFQGVGCGAQSITNGSIYSCQAGVGISEYNDLLIIMTNTVGGAQTLAAIDFE
jgi:hypothetical protein